MSASPRIELSLEDHCIQTAARRAHRELTDQLLDDSLTSCAADGGEALAAAEATLALLADFLEVHDFGTLRANYPELAGGHPVRVIIERAPDGRATYRVLGPAQE